MPKKRVFWLARSTEREWDVDCYRRRPKRTVVKPQPCACGQPGCNLNPVPGSTEFDGVSVFTFCPEGLEDAGIKIQEGELLKLTIEIEKK